MDNILFQLPEIIENSIKAGGQILGPVSLNEEIILRDNKDKTNYLYDLDNLDTIKDLLHKGYGGQIDLIYLDPPFFTLTNYNNRVDVAYKKEKVTIEYLAYSDNWKNFREYLEMLTLRLYLMRELLSETGTIYVHIDFRTVHYIRVIMDYLFGADNFLNEIIWAYKSGGTSNKYFSRKHDNVLVYTKTNNYIFNPQKEKSYNRGYKPYRFKGVKEYQDSLGWYTLVNLKDVWNIDMVGRTSRERVGYGTQKPEALLERIILSSSNEDSLVADFFAGSGTTLKVAENHNRRWIGSDKSSSSILTIRKRLGEVSNTYGIYSSDKTDADHSFEFERTYKNNNLLLSINLGKYILNLESLKISNKNKYLVNNILSEDSIALIDYVGIGAELPTPVIFYEECRSQNSLRINSNLNIRIPIEYANELLYIKVIDIFGNVTKRFIERVGE